jgi:hypothetical protein
LGTLARLQLGATCLTCSSKIPRCIIIREIRPKSIVKFTQLKLRGDTAYDSERIRRDLRHRRIKPLLNRRRRPRKYRKRTQAWINQYRRLKVRYERLQCTYQAFLNIACALIPYKRTRRVRKRF